MSIYKYKNENDIFQNVCLPRFLYLILTNRQNFGAYSVLLRVKNETLQQLLSI